jgi:transposase
MTTNPSCDLTVSGEILYMAIELSSTEWKLAFADTIARNPRVRAIRICDIFDVTRSALIKEIAAAKKAFGLPDSCKVVSCYEAGRQGFWVHRCLIAMGIQNFIVEPTSMLVNRKARRAKTDRLDAIGIVKHLMRYAGGDTTACRMIRIPDADHEDARHLTRELHELKGEKTSHTNRIKGLLETQGIALKEVTLNFKANLDTMLTADGRPLSEELKARLLREFDRAALVVEHIRELERTQGERLKQASKKTEELLDAREKRAEIAYRLCQLKGIGTVTAWTMSLEIFGWRDIKNRRQLAALAGLVPVPYDSGNSEREQGISKSGRAEFRCLMIEIAWMWLYYQPNSELSKWYRRRFDDGSKRNRKRGIVALARKLLIALGKYVKHGEIPKGCEMCSGVKRHYTTSLTLRSVKSNDSQTQAA